MLVLSRIRYFSAVADAGSFSLAARRLGVSQPTLSIQVAHLEKELGTPLFRRHRNGVTLTEAGQRLLARGRDLLTQMEELEGDLKSGQQEAAGELRVGCVHSVGTYILPEALVLLTQRYEKVRPTIRLEHSDLILDLLRSGDIDVAVTAHARGPRTRQKLLLVDDPLVLVCGPGHRLWGRRVIRPGDLKNERLIGFDEAAPTAQLVDRVLASRHVRMQVVIRAPQIAALIRMVRLNMGLAFLPRVSVAEEVDRGLLYAIPFAPEELHRGIWISWESSALFPARDAMIECLRKVVAERWAVV